MIFFVLRLCVARARALSWEVRVCRVATNRACLPRQPPRVVRTRRTKQEGTDWFARNHTDTDRVYSIRIDSMAEAPSHVGTGNHRDWLDRQLRVRGMQQTAVQLPPPPAPEVAVTVAPSGRRSQADTSLGSEKHANWLERQLNRPTPTAHTSPVPSSAPRQHDVLAPPGVNALRRGQDLSAMSHAEWLDRQLPPPPSIPQHANRMWPAPRSRALTAPPAAVAPLTPPPPELLASLKKSLHAHASGNEDFALGGSQHAHWLERQLQNTRQR